MRGVKLLLLIILCSIWDAGAQERIDPEKWVMEAETVLAGVENYTVIFHKQERIKGDLREEETIYLKFKKPFKVYMKWIEAPHRGRESLYVEGENDNRIKAHEGGILGFLTVNLDPEGSKAMKGNRHPITESGLHNLVKRIGELFRRGNRSGELESKLHGEEAVYGRSTLKVEGIFPREKDRGYYCYRAVINIDLEMKVPVKVRVYDWEDQLVENYGFEDLRLNADLTDADFDPKNREYRF